MRRPAAGSTMKLNCSVESKWTRLSERRLARRVSPSIFMKGGVEPSTTAVSLPRSCLSVLEHRLALIAPSLLIYHPVSQWPP